VTYQKMAVRCSGLVFLIGAAGTGFRAHFQSQVTFYVATNGNDGWSGTLEAPNAAKTEGPFMTLARARGAVCEPKDGQAPKELITVPVHRTGR